ncbi:SDR family NAD(P)-dependent oxidoreductase [Enterococcus gilvus]|uniref:Short chain dehydrogenase/reductase family oxidoreductase n=1 Tax=Enterococcus gilvus ATCC BAA-350 TaxID=1158614 RepID=R2VG20_9ENTE|nr:SDR family oxidoreductase [Enterococcus gilvus]EOI56526.1 short chain dehydrogenase/reductase family oxidoreductase [Enterococcus gilvus ATCC BAA-350]EOW82224.1 short chain dehydrogenase/reductase family oxidoreductase [Enterococcus gilvus ATCC BAA-350]OJG42221.1 short chain dehydrogenase/reductase family oxidoreductase [Enterococcus gilvus]
MDLTDKVVVVTGSSAGLGEQICYEAAKRGAIVVTCARRINLIGQVKERCIELSGKEAFAFQLDIADPDSVEAVIGKISEEVGDVDVLVNNAGFGLFNDFVSFDLDVARKMFEVNVLGMMYFTQKIAISMVDNKKGHIFNVASMAGKMATPKSTVYSATKFAVLGFSNALRLELRPENVYVTTINQGPIATDFFDKADPSGSYLENLGNIVLDPQKLAKTIVNKMGKPTREINRPFVMAGGSRFYDLFPHIGDLLAGGLFNRK